MAAAGLLGRDVVHRADRLVGHGLGLGLREARDAEVHHLDAAVLQQHDVLRLDVAVDDAALVRVLQRLQDLHRKVQRLAPLDLALLLDVLLERDAVHIFHDDVLDAVAEADVVHLDDVRVREHRDRLRFVSEAPEEIAVVRELLPEDLDGDPAVLDAVIRAVNVRHAALADQLVDLIAAVQALSDVFIHN